MGWNTTAPSTIGGTPVAGAALWVLRDDFLAARPACWPLALGVCRELGGKVLP